jgi:hypothetical protein
VTKAPLETGSGTADHRDSGATFRTAQIWVRPLITRLRCTRVTLVAAGEVDVSRRKGHSDNSVVRARERAEVSPVCRRRWTHTWISCSSRAARHDRARGSACACRLADDPSLSTSGETLTIGYL